MEERVHLVGGEMSITSDEKTGTRIQVRLPSTLDAILASFDAVPAADSTSDVPGAMPIPGVFSVEEGL
jgi:hypothetical protein